MSPPAIAILFPTLGPYHVARVESLNELIKSYGYRLFVYRFSKFSPIYKWNPEDLCSTSLISLLDRPCSTPHHSILVASRLFTSLRRNKIRAIFLPSFSPLTNFLCFIAAKVAGCKLILMTESWKNTESQLVLSKILKRLIIPMFDAALVGGSPHKRYVASYGLPPSKIFKGYDVVDVEYYVASSALYKEKREIGTVVLPSHYFLNLGRFVAKKNIKTLLLAYSLYLKYAASESCVPKYHDSTMPQSSQQPRSLVLVGDGNLKDDLVAEAHRFNLDVRIADKDSELASHPEVVIYGFQQYALTPFFFSNCDAFILPSLWEEWGLVVNEAQACGVPVIASSNAGCSEDLVQHGVNGFLFEPNDSFALSRFMYQITCSQSLRKKMGTNAQQTSREWTPSKFARGALDALNTSIN